MRQSRKSGYDAPRRSSVARITLPQSTHELFGVRVRQGANPHGIHQAEDGGVAGDPEREREQRNAGERGRAPQRANRVANVLPDALERWEGPHVPAYAPSTMRRCRSRAWRRAWRRPRWRHPCGTPPLSCPDETRSRRPDRGRDACAGQSRGGGARRRSRISACGVRLASRPRGRPWVQISWRTRVTAAERRSHCADSLSSDRRPRTVSR